MIDDESLIIFFGECGAGKSSLMLHFADKYVKEQAAIRLDISDYVVREINAVRKKPLKSAYGVPTYSNFDFNLIDGRGRKVIKTPIRGNDIGLNSSEEEKGYKYFFPASLIMLDEAHCEFNVKNEHLPRGQRDFFNKRRHNRLKIMLASPRAVYIHKDIRCSGAYGVEVRGMKHDYSPFGSLKKSTWFCREFPIESELERYIKSDGVEGEYIETEYTHNGDIFKLYNSYAFAKDFAPPEGEQYYLCLEEKTRI